MRDDSTRQSVLFDGLFDKRLVAQFDQPHGSSDGGAVLLKAVDEPKNGDWRYVQCTNCGEGRRESQLNPVT